MLSWKSDTHLVVDDVDFVIASGPNQVQAARAAAGQAHSLMLFKPRWMVECYERLGAALSPGNVLELGIYDGGSTAFLELLLQPRHLVALDLTPTRASALDAFIEARGLGDHVHAHFGIDQADRPSLERLVEAEFGGEELDLVIDDASHFLDETTASFNVLFPRLRPGGVFVIEDWSWQHYPDELIEKALASNPDAAAEMMRNLMTGETTQHTRPLSRFVLELALTAAYAEDIVAEVSNLRRGWVEIRRGDAPLDPATFDIRTCYGSLGRSVLAQNP